jgi:hypothetical protein
LLPVVVLLGALALLLGLAGCGPAAGTGAKADGPRLKFQEREHDFGKISNSQPTEYSFVFTNTGTQPLQIGEVEPEPPRAGT